MAKTPQRISLRVYPVGFGDCFLLGFHYAKQDDRYILIDFGSTELTKKRVPRSKPFVDYMKKVADDIAERCGRKNGKGGQLHAVIATHRHADHINGFATKTKAGATEASGDVIRSLKPKYIVQPWTEDPALKPNALGPKEAAKTGGARGFAASLVGMQAAAAGIVTETERLDAARLPLAAADETGASPTAEAAQERRGARIAYLGTVRFLGEDAIANRSAVENLIAMGKAGTPRYLHADQLAKIGLDGVKTHVLGPPTLKQSDAIRKQRTRDDVEFWMLMGATGTRFTAGGLAPFSSRSCVQGSKVPDFARWMRDHARAARVEALLGIVRILDKQMNNTSLILVFEVGNARLLFPGDAQIENWSYALANPDYRKLLADTTLYKVGHHGSRNATPKAGVWDKFKRRSTKVGDKKRLWSVVSTMPGKHGTTEATKVPRRTLVDALKAESNFRTTQDLKKAEVDFEDFEINPVTGIVTEVAKAVAKKAGRKPKKR